MKYMEPFCLNIEFENGNGFMTIQDNNEAEYDDEFEDEEDERETIYNLVAGQMQSYTKTEATPYWKKISRKRVTSSPYGIHGEWVFPTMPTPIRHTVLSGGLSVTEVNNDAGTITFRNGSGITATQLSQEVDRLYSDVRVTRAELQTIYPSHARHVQNHVAELARMTAQATETFNRTEAERREAQRLAEQQRLEAEQNRPSFLRRLTTYRRT